MKGVDEGYSTALCICGSPSRVACFYGLVSRVPLLLRTLWWWACCHGSSKQLISKYYPRPMEREKDGDRARCWFDGQPHQIIGLLLTDLGVGGGHHEKVCRNEKMVSFVCIRGHLNSFWKVFFSLITIHFTFLSPLVQRDQTAWE